MTAGPFQHALDQLTSREPLLRGKVRDWRRSLSPEDQLAFDNAVDDDRRITTADLHRAAVRAGGTQLQYHDVWAYRTAIGSGVQR